MQVTLKKQSDMSQEVYDNLCAVGGDYHPLLLGQDPNSGVLCIIAVREDMFKNERLSREQALAIEAYAEKFQRTIEEAKSTSLRQSMPPELREMIERLMNMPRAPRPDNDIEPWQQH